MIDFVKLHHRHPKIDDFIEMHSEHIFEQVHRPTGEKQPNIRFKKGHYKITIKKNDTQPHGYIHIEGSLHKSHFNGANYERFEYNMIQDEIERLHQTIGILPESLDIQNVEIGANLATKYPPFDFLRKNILLYKTKPFIQYLPGPGGKVIGYHCSGQPIVKIYDKGYQFDLPGNLLRFEVKHKRSTMIKKFGVETLADLLDRSRIRRLGKHLIETFERVLLYEPDIDSAALSAYQINLHKEAEHLRNWERWKAQYSTSGYEKRRSCYKRICEQHSSNEFGKLLAALKEEVYRCVYLPTALCGRVGFFTGSLSSKKSHSLLDSLPSFPEEDLTSLSSTDLLHDSMARLRPLAVCVPPDPDAFLSPHPPTFL